MKVRVHSLFFYSIIQRKLRSKGIFLGASSILFALYLSPSALGESQNPMQQTGQGRFLQMENKYFRFEIGENAQNVRFLDKTNGADYCQEGAPTAFASIKKQGNTYFASAASLHDGRLALIFGESGIRAEIKITSKQNYFIFEVISVSEHDIDELTFIDIPLRVKGTLEEPFAACALALNLKTFGCQIPGPNTHLLAKCFPRFGLEGAACAIIGCPPQELRGFIQEVVTASPELPKSSLGGAWALDADINKGSYMIDFYADQVSEATIDNWIKAAKQVGATQIVFHAGKSFRFGDYAPNPELYPRGLESVRDVVAKIHAAGLSAGLQTYAFFMAKDAPWVTPIPDPCLEKDATFTLSEPTTKESTTVLVEESTENMSTLTAFHVMNSVTLQIENELIEYRGIDKSKPYAFTQCERGVLGTTVSEHPKGAAVHHLKERFGLFAPEGDSTLFTEIADRTAEVYNTCDFDLLYIDALDGATLYGPGEVYEYYAAKYAYEVVKRLKRPACIGLSTFSHHLWHIVSRLNARDAPHMAYKMFIDCHFNANQIDERKLLPLNMGWWCAYFGPWRSMATQFMYPEDIEYLCCKSLAGRYSLSLLAGFAPEELSTYALSKQMAGIINRYEKIRLSGSISNEVKARLSAQEDFTLALGPDQVWRFKPIQYMKHKIEGDDRREAEWTVSNPFERQPLRMRIEALMSASPYDSASSVQLTNCLNPEEFSQPVCSRGVSSTYEIATDPEKSGKPCGAYSAINKQGNPYCAWSALTKEFAVAPDLVDHGFGLWVYGDGKGETINLHLQTPWHVSSGIRDYYIVADFTGWRYCMLVESESERLRDYRWPYFYKDPVNTPTGDYGLPYSYADAATEFKPGFVSKDLQWDSLFWMNYAKVNKLSVYYGNLPENKEVKCHIGPIKALHLQKKTMKNPTIVIGGEAVTFPVELESGCYIEFRSMADCWAYNQEGDVIEKIEPRGKAPMLDAGGNAFQFSCDPDSNKENVRAAVTIMATGEPFGEPMRFDTEGN